MSETELITLRAIAARAPMLNRADVRAIGRVAKSLGVSRSDDESYETYLGRLIGHLEGAKR